MCGFCGFTGYVENKEQIIKGMMDKIVHRGPDTDGVFTDDFATLGFRRLSIIDLEDGSQPISNEDGSLVIVMNGEVYNYKALREDLINEGHVFKTQSDTEVALHLYEKHGKDFLTMLRGMFAVTILDKKNNLIFGARDYFGIKPYYYTLTGDEDKHLIFGSEIKAILECPLYTPLFNEEALENYLTFQYSVLSESFFKGIMKLPPAHYYTYKDGQMTIERYWEPVFDEEPGMTFEDAKRRINETVDSSVAAHMVSDVEVGSFLSSGVDSSYVAATFKGQKTFTVGFDYDKYNEVSFAKKTAKLINIENHHKIITKQEYWDVLPKIMYQMDEPLADPSAVALYFVSELASKHVKVALSGEGADEFFGGYNIYREPISLAPMQKIPKPIRKLLGKVMSMIPLSFKGKNYLIRASKTVEERFIGNAFMFTKKERDKILLKPKVKYSPMSITKPFYDKVKDKDDITKMQYIDMHLWMVGDILVKADRMSMAHALEVRPPFLDIEVWKLAAKLPTRFKADKTGTKLAFRAAAKDRLPKETAEKKKLGFPVPIRVWLKEDTYYNKVKNEFMNGEGAKFFNKAELVTLLDNHRSGKADNSRKIWTVYMFLVWYNQFFAGKA